MGGAAAGTTFNPPAAFRQWCSAPPAPRNPPRSTSGEFSCLVVCHGAQDNLWTVAAGLDIGMRATVSFQPGHRQRRAEERRARQPVRLLSGDAPAAESGG